jgi:hypothetical protein
MSGKKTTALHVTVFQVCRDNAELALDIYQCSEHLGVINEALDRSERVFVLTHNAEEALYDGALEADGNVIRFCRGNRIRWNGRTSIYMQVASTLGHTFIVFVSGYFAEEMSECQASGVARFVTLEYQGEIPDDPEDPFYAGSELIRLVDVDRVEWKGNVYECVHVGFGWGKHVFHIVVPTSQSSY